ncbi:hypothetical protein PF008_g27214 [Phytophthora fragariae]|uniref:HTH myb-type domain-containing protein n=1 Tax=Phytophthora fragariae TaxID=53985 RepID=A0A6G0QET9_9STRA|nr:hypothetical protein PF008_g27214 [Phytophthora fragariae]
MNQERSPSPTSNDVPPAMEKPQRAKCPHKNRKRPTKRFLWQEDLHLRFVAAIFDLGLKNASPKAVLPLMQASDPDLGLTTEQLKSHLQKYRINHERSRREFQELCHREVKRNRKRRRREERADSAYIFPPRGVKQRNDSSKNETDSDSNDGENGDGNPNAEDQRLDPHSTGISPFRSHMRRRSHPLAQARVQEDVQTRMHEAMQAQMNFHRQMLTRKVELSHNLAGMANVNASGCLANIGSYNFNALGQGFERAWATFQQPPATHTPQQVTQYEAIQTHSPPVLQESFDAGIPRSSMPSLISTTPSPDAKADDVGDDLSRWDPFNVDLDGDDLFDFLRA